MDDEALSAGIMGIWPYSAWGCIVDKQRRNDRRAMVIAGLTVLVWIALIASGRPPLQILTLGLVVCVLGYASYRDLEAFTIPNGCVLALIGIWLAGSVAAVFPGLGSLEVGAAGIDETFAEGMFAAFVPGIVGALASGGLSFAIAFVYKRITGRVSLGMGDVKLYFATGLYLGLNGGLFNLLLSSLIGLVFAAVWQAVSLRRPQGASLDGSGSPNGEKQPARHAAFPFGPAIALSTCILLLI